MTAGALVLVFAGLDALEDHPRRDYDLFYIAFATTVPFQFFLTRKSRLDQKIGEYSYPIYVFHFAIAAVATQHVTEDWRGEVVLAATLALSALYLTFIDRPVQRLRARIAERSGSTIAPATPPPLRDVLRA